MVLLVWPFTVHVLSCYIIVSCQREYLRRVEKVRIEKPRGFVQRRSNASGSFRHSFTDHVTYLEATELPLLVY
jgi:hypothetical protein